MDSDGGLFDTPNQGNFETQEDGSVLFYPYVWSRSAYRVANQGKQERIRSSMRRLSYAAIAGSPLPVLVFSTTPVQFLAFVLPALVSIFFLARQVLIWRLVGDCGQVEVSTSFTSRFRRQAEAMRTTKAWLVAGANLAIFLSFLFLSWVSVPVQEGWIVLGLLVFGPATVAGATQLYYSRRVSTGGT